MISANDIKELNNLFALAKKESNKKTKSKKTTKKSPKGTGGRRSVKKWVNQFKISKKLFESLSELDQEEDDDLIREACVGFRNPVVFDNQVSDAVFELPYYIPVVINNNMSDDEKKKNEVITKDHLVGMSNIVLYIYENKIHQRWNTHEDFIRSLKALQVLLKLPKVINDSKVFKSWQFDRKNINDCIYWNKKLKNAGITHVFDENGNQVSVDDVWSDWYENNKSFL